MQTRTSAFDPRPDSYKSFYDDKWANDLLGLTEGSKLEIPFIDLAHNWKSISNARTLPWLMATSLDLSLVRDLQTIEPLANYKIRAFRDKLVDRLSKRGRSISSMLKDHIQKALIELDDEICETLKQAREQITDQQESHWVGLLEQVDFATSLWGLERLCYGGIYYNYEGFLTACVRIKLNNPKYAIRRADEFKEAFNKAFGQELQQECWGDQPVVIARYARHALVHNGGRLTDNLAKQPHTFLIERDEIQIGAPHTTALHNNLKGKVSALCNAAIKLPEFKTSS